MHLDKYTPAQNKSDFSGTIQPSTNKSSTYSLYNFQTPIDRKQIPNSKILPQIFTEQHKWGYNILNTL